MLTLTIDGSAQSITISGASTYPVINNNGGNLTVNALTIADGGCSGITCGGDGAGIFSASSGTNSLTVTNSTFYGNSAFNGGAISSGAPLTITHSTFSGNSASNFGGAITGSKLTVTNSVFSGNARVAGDALRVGDANAALRMTASAGGGGAIATSVSAKLV